MSCRWSDPARWRGQSDCVVCCRRCRLGSDRAEASGKEESSDGPVVGWGVNTVNRVALTGPSLGVFACHPAGTLSVGRGVRCCIWLTRSDPGRVAGSERLCVVLPQVQVGERSGGSVGEREGERWPRCRVGREYAKSRRAHGAITRGICMSSGRDAFGRSGRAILHLAWPF
jgi:hypothetical protein